jgi:hypothetical protein
VAYFEKRARASLHPIFSFRKLDLVNGRDEAGGPQTSFQPLTILGGLAQQGTLSVIIKPGGKVVVSVKSGSRYRGNAVKLLNHPPVNISGPNYMVQIEVSGYWIWKTPVVTISLTVVT